MAPKRKQKQGSLDVENGGAEGEGAETAVDIPAPKPKKSRQPSNPEEAGAEMEILQLRNPPRPIFREPEVEEASASASAPVTSKKKGTKVVEPDEVEEVQQTEQHLAGYADPRVGDVLAGLQSGTEALRANSEAPEDTQHFLDSVQEIANQYPDQLHEQADHTAYAEAPWTAEEYAASASYYAEHDPGQEQDTAYAAPAKRVSTAKRGRPPGPRREAPVFPTKKFKLDDRVYLIAEEHWDRVVDFFGGLEMEGLAQVSTLQKDFRNAVGEVGARPGGKPLFSSEPYENLPGTPASGGEGGLLVEAMQSGPPVARRIVKDREYWNDTRIEALRQGQILYAPYRDRDALTITHFYRTGIFGERRGPALKDKRRNLLSKILREKREKVTVDDMLPWIWSLVNPAEKKFWEDFELANPGWREEAAEKLWPIRMALMAQLGVGEEDLVAAGVKSTKDTWWIEWEARKAAEFYELNGGAEGEHEHVEGHEHGGEHGHGHEQQLEDGHAEEEYDQGVQFEESGHVDEGGHAV